MASAVYKPGGPIPENAYTNPHSTNIGRDVFRLTGKVQIATKSLKGRLAVAQPPGATMAVRENKLARVAVEVKTQPRIQAILCLPAHGSFDVPAREIRKKNGRNRA
jgi:hypothetical protein